MWRWLLDRWSGLFGIRGDGGWWGHSLTGLVGVVLELFIFLLLVWFVLFQVYAGGVWWF